jgi:pSer/pThr/pTyr-binding forkhead associated (FHA) protein
MFILRSLRNPKEYIQIGTTPIRIGRGADNALVIREKSVSRAHATIQLESGAPVLTDLKSTHGTYVNGVQVRRQQLNPGDVISFGTVQWRLEESTSSRSMPKSKRLVLSSVSNPRQQFPLTDEPVNIGRGPMNQLRLPDKSISREHALIRFENGKYVVLDKNSSSGTFVNNKLIQKAVLKPGDVIAFGDDRWRVMSAEASQPRSASQWPIRQPTIGQIHIGSYSLSPDPVYGGALQSADRGQVPEPQDRRPPIYVRPCHFGAIVNRKTEVKAASASGPNSPLQFYGPHGAGKSTLLCYLAHQPFAVTFPDGIIHLLARGRGVIDILQNIYNAFYDQHAGFIATEGEIRTRLQSKNALILLDDVELDPESTSELLAAAPKCTFILASTQRCLPKGGRIIELDNFKSDDALELFGKVLGRGLNAEEIPLVKMICSTLGNTPVRIIQAASYVRGMQLPIGGVASALNIAVPVNGLNNLIVQSLSDAERHVVAILATLGGGSIHNRHLPSLVGTKNTKGVLEGLMGRGLVRESDNRYSLAGTFVEYLQQEWDLSDWAIRILEHFSGWVERHQEQPEYVLYETEAILAILSWAVRAGRWQGVLRLCRGVESLMMIGKQWGTWQTVLQSGLQAAQMLGDQAAEAWALHQLGTRAMCLGDPTTARSALEQAFKIRQSIGDRVGAELTRQNQSLLSISPAAPPQPPAPKPTPRILRPLFLAGGAAAVITIAVAAALLLPKPEPPAPIPEPVTAIIFTPIIVTDTMSPIGIPTDTDIPTGTGINTFTRTVTPTGTRTITPTATRTITPTKTPSFTPTKTPTPSLTQPPPGFGSPQLTTNQVYYGGSSCGSDSVTIRIMAEHPVGIKYMYFFHKLREIDGNNESNWSEGLPMNATSGGTYSLSVSGDRLVENTGFTTPARVSYQFIIQPQSGDLVRSDFYRDLVLLPCISPEPPPTTPPPPRPPAPQVINPQYGEKLPCSFGTAYLRWSEPYDVYGIQSYQIKLIEEIKPGLGQYVISPLTVYDTQYNISSIINCGKNYEWTVRALNNNGVWSEFSSSKFSVSPYILK